MCCLVQQQKALCGRTFIFARIRRCPSSATPMLTSWQNLVELADGHGRAWVIHLQPHLFEPDSVHLRQCLLAQGGVHLRQCFLQHRLVSWSMAFICHVRGAWWRSSAAASRGACRRSSVAAACEYGRVLWSMMKFICRRTSWSMDICGAWRRSSAAASCLRQLSSCVLAVVGQCDARHSAAAAHALYCTTSIFGRCKSCSSWRD